jgi:hypothetical protein
VLTLTPATGTGVLAGAITSWGSWSYGPNEDERDCFSLPPPELTASSVSYSCYMSPSGFSHFWDGEAFSCYPESISFFEGFTGTRHGGMLSYRTGNCGQGGTPRSIGIGLQ